MHKRSIRSYANLPVMNNNIQNNTKAQCLSTLITIHDIITIQNQNGLYTVKISSFKINCLKMRIYIRVYGYKVSADITYKFI